MKWLFNAVKTTMAVQRIVISVGATVLVTLGIIDVIKERKKHGTRSGADGVRK